MSIEHDEVGTEHEEVEQITTDLLPEDTDEAPKAAAATDDDDDEDHPGAKEDKEDQEALAKAAKAAEAADKNSPAPGAEVPTQFAPNFKVKAYGKEFEIPEKFRSLMTDAATEKEVRDVFEKAFAIEEYKPKQEAIRQKLEQYEQKILPAYAKQDAFVQEAMHHTKNKDFDSFFETVGINTNDVLRWVEQKLSFTPEQAALYNQNRELQKTLYRQSIESTQLKGAYEQTQETAQQAQVQAQIQELEFTLSKGDFAKGVQSYDEKNGANAFRNLVIKHGAYASNVEGRKLSFDEAAKEVFERVSPAIGTQTNVPTTKAAAPKEKPTLPVVSARPVSPTVQKPKSIAELRKKAEKYSPLQDE